MRSALLVAALAMMVCGFTGCSITGTPGGNGSCDGLTAGGCDSFAGGCDGRLIVSRRCGGSCQDCAGGRFFGRLPCRTIASPGLCGIGTKLGWNGIGCSSCGGGAIHHSDGYHETCRDACGGRFIGGLGFGCGGLLGSRGGLRAGLRLGCGCNGDACDGSCDSDCDTTVPCSTAANCDDCGVTGCDGCAPAPGGLLGWNRNGNACDDGACDDACDGCGPAPGGLLGLNRNGNVCDNGACDDACDDACDGCGPAPGGLLGLNRNCDTCDGGACDGGACDGGRLLDKIRGCNTCSNSACDGCDGVSHSIGDSVACDNMPVVRVTQRNGCGTCGNAGCNGGCGNGIMARVAQRVNGCGRCGQSGCNGRCGNQGYAGNGRMMGNGMMGNGNGMMARGNNCNNCGRSGCNGRCGSGTLFGGLANLFNGPACAGCGKAGCGGRCGLLGGAGRMGGRPLGCGQGGCGIGGRLCGNCRVLQGGLGSMIGNPYGNTPHTPAVNPYAGGAAAGGPAAAYSYPYYTTRGPRDFLMCNPPSIGN